MSPDPRLTAARRTGTRHLLGGILLLAFAAFVLLQRLPWFSDAFYAWAWWGVILVFDGYAARQRGHSLLTTRRRLFLPLCFSSIAFWFFFELLNLRFQNWYYVGVFPCTTWSGVVGAGLFVLVAFATVFVGIFTAYEALTASGLWRSWRGTPRALPVWSSYAVQAVGLTMAACALLFPRYLAPLIWGSFSFLVDPWNYRRGRRALLRDVEARDWGLIARFFAAGLLCGLIWESLNFYAPQKWIYTVRGLEHLKLFEMPLLGFLGFPALAFDSLAGFALFAALFLGGRTWEHPADLAYALPPPSPTASRSRWAVALLVAPVLWVAIGLQIIRTNVGSVRLDLHDFVSAAELADLRAAGVRTPSDLLDRCAGPAQSARLEQRLGWNSSALHQLERRVALASFKGIGAFWAGRLEQVGVLTRADLRSTTAEELHARWLDSGNEPVPRLDMLRVWTLASHSPGLVQAQRKRTPPSTEG